MAGCNGWLQWSLRCLFYACNHGYIHACIVTCIILTAMLVAMIRNVLIFVIRNMIKTKINIQGFLINWFEQVQLLIKLIHLISPVYLSSEAYHRIVHT